MGLRWDSLGEKRCSEGVGDSVGLAFGLSWVGALSLEMCMD